MTPAPMTPDEERYLPKILAVAETLHELPPDKQQQMLADLEQAIAECQNPNERSFLKGVRTYQARGQLEYFMACLRSIVHQEDKKMSNENETPKTPIPPVDRATAAKLNPLINPHDTTETLGNVSDSLTLLGQTLVCCDNSKTEIPNFGRLLYLIGALSAALDYESEVQRGKRGTPEAPVKRIK